MNVPSKGAIIGGARVELRRNNCFVDDVPHLRLGLRPSVSMPRKELAEHFRRPLKVARGIMVSCRFILELPSASLLGPTIADGARNMDAPGEADFYSALYDRRLPRDPFQAGPI